MIQFILKVFSDSGDVSMMRLMSFLCVVSAIIIAISGIYRGSDLGNISILVSSFLVPAFTGKVIQKRSETEV